MPQKKSALGCQQLGPTAFRKVFRSFFGIFCKRQCAFTKSACSCGVMGPVPPRQTQPRQLRPGRQTPLGAVGVSSPCPGWLVLGRIVAGLPPRLPRSLFGCAPFSSELLYLPGRAEGYPLSPPYPSSAKFLMPHSIMCVRACEHSCVRACVGAALAQWPSESIRTRTRPVTGTGPRPTCNVLMRPTNC